MVHDEALTFGGREGVTSLHLVESAIARPYSGYHRPIYQKAAALLDSVANNHGFTDANKRTGWYLVEILIERSSYRLDIPDDEPVDDVVVGVVDGTIKFDELVTWFKMRVVRA